MKIKFRIYELLAEKSAREGRTITATEAARYIGISHNTMLAYANNTVERPELRVVAKLLKFFDCKLENLMATEEEAELIAV